MHSANAADYSTDLSASLWAELIFRVEKSSIVTEWFAGIGRRQQVGLAALPGNTWVSAKSTALASILLVWEGAREADVSREVLLTEVQV